MITENEIIKILNKFSNIAPYCFTVKIKKIYKKHCITSNNFRNIAKAIIDKIKEKEYLEEEAAREEANRGLSIIENLEREDK